MVGLSGQNGGRRWYVSVDQKVYGPFDEPTLWSYVQEGRVTAQSQLSNSPSGPFGIGAQNPAISHWFARQETTESVQPKLSLHLVMADIRSPQSMAFLQTLQSLGPVERLGDTVWLVQTRLTVEQTRRTLGPALSVADNLFILDASSADFATVNLSAETNDRVRSLFDTSRS